jgi:hypothetical protein
MPSNGLKEKKYKPRTTIQCGVVMIVPGGRYKKRKGYLYINVQLSFAPFISLRIFSFLFLFL